MFRILRILTIFIGGFAASLSAARAEGFAEPDRSAALSAIAAARNGDWARAYAEAGNIRDPLPLKLVRWLDYTKSIAAGRFGDIAEFIQHNPHWPYMKTIQRGAESALATESDATVAAWFNLHPPISAAGKVRQAEVMISRGQNAAATDLLRKTWIEDDFMPADERNFWAKYGGAMRPEDNVRRLDRLLWDGEHDEARRLLPFVPSTYQALAQARLALGADARDVAAAVARVPAALQADPGLAFDEVRWRRKKDMDDDAARLLLAHPDNPERPIQWATERQVVARRLLATGNAQLAYQIVQQNGLSDGAAYAEAEFLAGYIALRYFKKPELAFDHFSHILARVSSPYAKARASYWSGRAAEAEGKRDLALKWYAAGAENMATFYGQLCAHKLGHDAPPHPTPEPRPDPSELAGFEAREQVRAAELLAASGDREHTKMFIAHLAERAENQLDFAMIAALAESVGRFDLAILVAHRAMEAGAPLMVHGYPITALPPGGTVEAPLLYAIVREESAFDQYATSPVGARGLMQLMPATASNIARRLQISFSPDRLTVDGTYNLLLGRSYLEGLLDDFGGSYALAIAGYNAGPGRVRQWLHDYGDPRGQDVNMVDWIETIPFTETRVYVQRVLENLQIYRGQSHGNTAAFSLASDLAR